MVVMILVERVIRAIEHPSPSHGTACIGRQSCAVQSSASQALSDRSTLSRIAPH
jgi:hypothetical protein